MNPDPSSAPPENAGPLQDQIRLLVQRFLHHHEALPDVCRELCRLARHHHVAPEDFRKRLRLAGLPASRASELKQVLESPTELEDFLRPTNPVSWRVTLEAARRRAAAAALAAARRTRADDIWSQIAGLMYRHQIFVAQAAGLELRLRPLPPPSNRRSLAMANAFAPLPAAARIAALVGQWKAAARRQRQGHSYRLLVRYCRFHRLGRDQYRDQLLAAKLHPTQVSRIHRILCHPTAATDFARGRCSFRQALAVARGRGNQRRQPAGPNFQRELEKLLRNLREALEGEPTPGGYQCGLFELQVQPVGSAGGPAAPPAALLDSPAEQLIAGPPAASGPRFLKFQVAPATAAKLDGWARRSGLNRKEATLLVLARMPWAALHEILPAAPHVGPFWSAAEFFRLQRRINPARSFADPVTVAVVLPGALRQQLRQLAQRGGLRLGALANLLLEPDAANRLRAIGAARPPVAADRGAALQQPFPDLGWPPAAAGS